jgi:rubrerythrin
MRWLVPATSYVGWMWATCHPGEWLPCAPRTCSGGTVIGMTVAHFFDRAISWERAAEAFYSALAEMFAADLAVRDIWLKMAADEALHVTLLETGLAHLADDQKTQALTSHHELANRLESSEINSVFQMLVLDKLEPDTRSELVRSQFEEHVARLAELRHAFTREERRALSCS